MNERIPLSALQKAIVARLTLDVSSVTVKTVLLMNTAMPCIHVGGFSFQGSGTKTSNVEEIGTQIDVYSNTETLTEVNEIINKIINAFSRAPMTLDDDFEIEFDRREMGEALAESHPDGPIQHGIVRMRFQIRDKRNRPN